MKEYILLIVVGFLAGIINTLAGGGSVMTLPMLIFMGLPPNVANGTNRIAIFIQNIFGTAGFRSKGVKDFPFNIYMGISATIGAVIGAKIGVNIKGEYFNAILGFVMLFVVIMLFFKPNVAKTLDKIEINGKHFWQAIIAFFFIGIYGGFIQAGTGFFILLALSKINNFSLVRANAIKSFVILFFTIAALAVYILNDAINWEVGLILAMGNSLGAWLASRWSVGKSDKLIKRFLLVIVVIMATKLWFPELFS
jgi:uncharacterized membrane protein YfcA